MIKGVMRMSAKEYWVYISGLSPEQRLVAMETASSFYPPSSYCMEKDALRVFLDIPGKVATLEEFTSKLPEGCVVRDR